MINEYELIANELGKDNKAFENKRILLCGSNGFLGRLYQEYFYYLNKWVLTRPCKVICLDNFAVDNDVFGWKDHFEHHNFDINNDQDGLTFSLDNIHYVINLAGIASPKNYCEKPIETLMCSVNGTNNLLSFCRENKSVLAYLGFSSSEIYGDPPTDQIPTSETYLGGIDAGCERGCYDVGKLALENLCYIYNTKYGINTKIIRPFNVLGYCGNDGRVVPNSVSRLIKNQKIKVFTPGTQTRTFCWFTDFLVGTIKVLLHGGNSPYNIGNSNNEISMIDLAHKLEKIAGLENMIEMSCPSDVYKTEPQRRCPSIRKAERELGYFPKITLDVALERFYSWAVQNY